MLKILYVGSSLKGSTNLGRVSGLKKAGCELVHFSSDPWVKHGSRFYRGIHNRLNTGPLIWGFNRAIRSAIQNVGPDILWIDKGIWVDKSVLLGAKERGVFTVHYTPDPAIQFHATKKFINSIPLYDLMFTTKRWEMEDYVHLGAKKICYSPKGTDNESRRPMLLSEAELEIYSSDVVFVGHAETHYVKTIKEIISLCQGVRFNIWGKWATAVKENPELRQYWQGAGVFGDDYARALSGAKIGLGFLSKLVPETETARTFEIPACRTLLLAERTESHQILFEEGVEAEFFDNAAEAASKIKMLLASPKKIETMSNAGYQRFIRSNYTVETAMAECIETIKTILAKGHFA